MSGAVATRGGFGVVPGSTGLAPPAGAIPLTRLPADVLVRWDIRAILPMAFSWEMGLGVSISATSDGLANPGCGHE